MTEPDDAIVIQSGPARLTLSHFSGEDSEGWYSFWAEFHADGIRATARVHDNACYNGNALVALFFDMARDWRGWEGEKSWSAMESQLSLVCTSDRLGHAFVAVTMTPDLGTDRWTVEGSMQLDAVQHELIAKQLQRTIGAVLTRGSGDP